MTRLSIVEIVNSELHQRELLESELMSIILTGFVIGDGKVRRSIVQNYVYKKLGFQGRSGNNFARFINKLLVEKGCRLSMSAGKRVYFGIKPIIKDI